MTPSEKNSAVKVIETAARQIVHKVVLIVAQEESDTIQGTLDKKWTVNGETLEAKVKFDNADNETLMDLFGLAGHRVVIVSADDKRFMSARGSQDQGTDQVEMPLAWVEPTNRGDRILVDDPHSTPPAGATDLNPDDDNGDPIGDIIAAGNAGIVPADTAGSVFGVPSIKTAEPDKTHGIYDNSTSEWLAKEGAEGEDDIWTDLASDAKAFTEAEAKAFVAQVGAPMEALPLDGG